MHNINIYIETYGCQMNFADTEIVTGILKKNGYKITLDPDEAGIVLLNTCSIRENAEQRIFGRLGNLNTLRSGKPELIIGILGCMAERLKGELINKKKLVDIVVGPDEYRRLPEFIESAWKGEKGIGVRLSRTETYEDIEPYREDGLQAWISIMRGCNNFCSYCVVPYTRGRERSRSFTSIVDEIKRLSERGFKEITLLGQNVNSYGFEGHDFADLITACAAVDKSMRIRFTTSHPRDLSDKLIGTIASSENICKYIHLPVQSGSDSVLENMNRSYTIGHYLGIIEKARRAIPDVSFSTDIIAGFCGETEDDHIATLNLMKQVRYDGAFMFKYSAREGTKAFKMKDDVPEDVKSRRLQEIIDLQLQISFENNQTLIGKTETLLIEGFSKKSGNFMAGRTDSNKVAVFPFREGLKEGDYVNVKIQSATSGTLIGVILNDEC